MKNLIAELLVKLAEKEEESKELVIKVEALEIVVTALLRHMSQPEQRALLLDIESTQTTVISTNQVAESDSELLHQHIKKLLQYPRH